ncbi:MULTISPECIES: GvpL/GvpF family gas vesicle protein [unclassified Streptomyces]|uniref:GvpL/GvpF family gas vesicle protein n=1 Tax=unclassified Streptomyces TaxID=2593676 RepID=UPI0034117617
MADTTTAPHAVCVFAVRRGRGPDLPPELSGHEGGGPLRLIPVGALWAVVQDVPADTYSEESLHGRLSEPATLERCVRAHHAVVTAFAARGAAIPLPLATLFHSQERARTALLAHAPRFERGLARIAGRAEWAVKVNLLATSSPAPREPTPTPTPATGRAYLTRLRARGQAREQRRERAVQAAELLDRAVLSLADATVRRRPHSAEVTGRDRAQIMNAAYLVPEDRAAELLALVEQLRAAPEFRDSEVEVTGPWVPYSFVDAASFTEVASSSGDRPSAIAEPSDRGPHETVPQDAAGSRA